MAIPKETVDRIYDAAKIEEVVGDYVSLRKRGANMWGLCPFHAEKTPSFSVSPSRNIYKCFGCGKGGNAVNFITEIEQCGYREALTKLAHKYHIEIEERELSDEEKQALSDRESMFVVNEWANQWFQEQLWETEEGRAIGLSYLHQRGLRDETIRCFGLGYCPEKGNPMTKAAQQAGHKDKFLVNDPETRIGTGICGRSQGDNSSGSGSGRPVRLYDRFHERVIFPFYGISGKTVGFAGRLLVKKDNVGKYVNSPESLVYTKGRELYGMFQAKQTIIRQQKCYLVEGQMDCIAMSQAGIRNVVSSGGTGLTKEQIGLIHRFTDNVTILYDGDAAGVHASLRGIDMFLEQGLNVKVMLFPDGDDPDSFSRKHTAEEFVEYIKVHEEDFISYVARTLMADARGDIHKRAEAIHSIVHSIALIGDKILQGEYIKVCAQLMDRDIPTLTREVGKERRRIYHKDDSPRQEQKSATEEMSDEQQYLEQMALAAEGAPHADSGQPANSGQAADASQLIDGGKHTKFDKLDENSRNLLRMLVRYGERKLVFYYEGNQTYEYLIGDYMQIYMQQTQIRMENPLYQAFFDEFNRHKAEPGFCAENCFVRNENQYIAQLAVDLLSQKHQLSKIYLKNAANGEEMTDVEIHRAVIQLLYELHYTVVENSLCLLDRQLREAEAMHDDAMTMTIMQAQNQLGDIKRHIGELLGKN